MKHLKRIMSDCMSLIKNLCLSTALILVSTLVALFLIEFALKTFVKNEGWDATREANILRNFEFNYGVRSLLKSNTPIHIYKRNEFGLRDNCASTEEIEILTVGGSTTDQRYVQFESTYQQVLQRRLTTEYGFFGCVTNAGVDGHSTWGHIFSFEKWFPLIPNLSPSFVLLYVGVNDADFQRQNEPMAGFDVIGSKNIKARLKKLEIIQRLLPLYWYLKKFYGKERSWYSSHGREPLSLNDYTVSMSSESTVSLVRENTVSFRRRFKRLLEQVKDLGASPICVSQPHRYVIKKGDTNYGVENVIKGGFSGIDYDQSIRAINSVMAELCGVYFLDLYNFEFYTGDFYDGVHTNEAGSRRIGNAMADFLINAGIDTQLSYK